MRRREFIAGLACATVAGAARAQSTRRVFRLSYISNAYDVRDLRDPAKRANFVFLPAFLDELRRLGYAEGENLTLEFFSTAKNTVAEILPAVLNSKPDVIFANSPTLDALNRASNGIPVVTVIADPVGSGFTKSLSKPDGNITGLTIDGGFAQLEKTLEIISELVGKPTPIGALRSQRRIDDPTPWLISLIATGERLGMPVTVVRVEEPLGPEQYRRAIHDAAQKKIGALLETSNEHIAFHRTIVALAAEEKIPVLFSFEQAVRMGGLAFYGPDLNKLARQLAGYVDRILKGAAVADLPFSQPTTFRLVINAKTARELGLTLPQSLLIRADEVIE